MEPVSRFVHANGINLHLLDWGNNGPPLLLLHPTSFCARVWAPTVGLLADRFHAMAIDMRGHGDSDKPRDGYTWETFGADLAGVLDALDLRDVLVVGHSRGGGVTIMGTTQRLWRVKAVMLIEPNLIQGSRTRTAMPGGLLDRAQRRRVVWPSRQTAFDAYRRRDVFQGWRPEALWAYVEGGFHDRADGQVELKCPPEVEAAYYQATISSDPWETIARMTVPVLMVAGGTTGRFDRDNPRIERFFQAVPHARHRVVPGAGHYIPQQMPEVVAETILSFAAEVGVLGRVDSHGPL